jgi:hypothetical protein
MILYNTVSVFMLIMTGTWAIRNTLFSFCSKNMGLSIVAKFLWIIVGSRAVEWIFDLLRSALIDCKIIRWATIVHKAISPFVLVISRSWTVRNSLLAFGAKHMGLSIITELTTVIVGARSVAGVSWHNRPALIVAKIMSRVSYLCNFICFFVLIMTGTWAIKNALFVLGTKHVSLRIVTKSMWVIILSRSVIRLDFLWRSARTVTKVPCWTSLVCHPISLLVLIVSRSWTLRNALFAFGAKHMGLSIITELTTVVVSARSVKRIDDLVLPTSILTEIISWIASLAQRIVRLVGAWSNSCSLILLPSLAKCKLLEPDSELVVIVVLAWAQVGSRVEGGFSSYANRVLRRFIEYRGFQGRVGSWSEPCSLHVFF